MKPTRPSWLPIRSVASATSRPTCAWWPVSYTHLGYIDMPPFPPGITRSDEQREQATQGAFEAVVMGGLRGYAHAERFLPGAIRRRQSHIVFALTGV